MKRLFKGSFQIIRENRKPYIWINVIFFGSVIIGMIFSLVYPIIQINLLKGLHESFRTGFYSPFYSIYYLHRNVPLAIELTFIVNLFQGTFISISLPSLIIPFSGFIVFIYRAVLWGIVNVGHLTILKVVLIILEGQGYVIGAFGVYLLAVRFIRPLKHGFHSHGEGYFAGLKIMGKLYVLIVTVLLVSACYEVAISRSNIVFHNFSYTNKQLGFSGTNVKLNYSGSQVFYDSSTVLKGDAKVVGIMLEDALYFKPGNPNAIRICKVNSGYEIQLYLDKTYWNNEKVAVCFKDVEKKLYKLYDSRSYHIAAFYYDSKGAKREKIF